MTSEKLIAELHDAVKEERRSIKRVLLALMEFDARDLFAERGFSSSFDYCTKVLGYAEGAAYKRINVARLAREQPEILDRLETGAVNLSSVSIMFPHLRKEGGMALLDQVQGKTAREVRSLAGSLDPELVKRDVIRPIAVVSSFNEGSAPLKKAEEAFRIAFTAGRRLYDKLQRAKDLSRHRIPDGRLEAIIEDAVDALLDGIDRGRKPRRAEYREVLPGRRRIPQWVKDEVWTRDGGTCAFVAAEGRRCDAVAWLEYDHITPFARGGRSDDPGNVRLLCRAHNQQAARAAFGSR